MIERGASLWRDAWLRLRKNRLAVFGAVLLGVVIVLAVAGPWFCTYTYYEQDTELGACGPSFKHWLGTDPLGRDLLVRVFFGGRVSLLVGLTATLVSLIIGVFYGAVAGFMGGRLDGFMMRIVDILYALPFTILVIILMVFFGQTLTEVFPNIGAQLNVALLFVAIGAVQWLTMARIVRSQVLSLREKEFIEATLVMGLRRRQVLAGHLIPNALGPIIVYATLTVPNVMLIEAFLSFLGLGVQPPMSSWGLLIKEGVETMEEFPWLLVFPSIALSVTLFSLNFLGDGLRDALDPRVSKD